MGDNLNDLLDGNWLIFIPFHDWFLIQRIETTRYAPRDAHRLLRAKLHSCQLTINIALPSRASCGSLGCCDVHCAFVSLVLLAVCCIPQTPEQAT